MSYKTCHWYEGRDLLTLLRGQSGNAFLASVVCDGVPTFVEMTTLPLKKEGVGACAKLYDGLIQYRQGMLTQGSPA